MNIGVLQKKAAWVKMTWEWKVKKLILCTPASTTIKNKMNLAQDAEKSHTFSWAE